MDRPQHKQPIGMKCVYRTKLNVNGSINKHSGERPCRSIWSRFFINNFSCCTPCLNQNVACVGCTQTLKKLPLRRKFCIFKWLFAKEIYVEQPKGFQVKEQEVG